jgi:rhamnosyl/mannosyltransferase
MKKGSRGADLLIGIYERLLLPRLLKRANAVICVSDFVRQEFLARYSGKSVTITPGVDGRRFWPAQDRRVPGRVLFIGDFRDPRKGLHHLITAVGQVPGASLLVLGQGSGPAAPHVQYAGIQTGPALVRAIQSASLLVLPSTTDAESFGMVLLEAMACGVPVVGSDIGGIPYVINHGHNGLLVTPSDPVALAQTIQHVLAYPQLAAHMGAQGRRDAVQHYNWQERIKHTHNLFELVRREASRG